eukprot:CAMPEP_0197578254 /NCGR_PEP_ID=MMETSP1326-20131121/2554_1 /TAXON_ID=1155430 /ORGANISM="Genus nov. species nov., Strain RCC2288" /LENGTH=164 /DNA_ID=CAMNT_0043141423 /DNA_START=81 /DNA_END=572 /DNA_ORIENTATION=+
MASDGPATLKVKSNDGHSVELSKDEYSQSKYLTEQSSIGGEVEMFSMEKAALEKVVEFLKENAANPIPISEIEQNDPFAPEGEIKKIPKPLNTPNLAEANFPEWSVKWVDSFSQEELFEYAKFADELDVHGLTLLLCAKIASIIKAMPLEAYHATFKLDVDYTP